MLYLNFSWFAVPISLVLLFCTSPNSNPAPTTAEIAADTTTLLQTRFPAPNGFERVPAAADSYGHWLRNLSLKPPGTPVKLFDGSLKSNQKAHAAVVDMDTGKRDLQQCADASMRLWAEYCYHQKAYNKIHFNLTNGFRVDFSKWIEGYRVQVSGNKTTWVKSQKKSDSYATLRAYLDFVFAYAGSLSLSKELPEVPLINLQPGDIIIQGGSPGHVVVVLDVVKHPKTGEKRFLIGQSYMPAQDFHVLLNKNNPALSPWYKLEEMTEFRTPEWTFSPVVVRRFSK
jgi:hypothetical protein